MFQTSSNGKKQIKLSEGFVGHVYSDIGAPAIAYGHRLLPGEAYPNGISEADGSKLLDRDLVKRFEPLVNARVPAHCTQSQFDALVSFTYNVRNQPSSLDQLLSHGWDQVPVQLLRWCHALDIHTRQEVEDPSLKARRQREADLFRA